MEFKKNKKYYSSLTEIEDCYWLCDNPLFLCGNKGLFPVYRAEKRYGVLNKNYHELVLKEIPESKMKELGEKAIPGNNNAKNILSFEKEVNKKNELFKKL